MNRETIIAILLGFTGGILVAFLLVTVPKKLPQLKKEDNSPTPTQNQPENSQLTDNKLEITTPENGIVVEGEEIEISGTSKANTHIVVSGPSEDIVVTSDENGKFSAKLSIYEGENLFTVTSYPENDKPVTTSVSVFATQAST